MCLRARRLTGAFVKLETQNVAWKHNEDDGIWAALPTSLFGQSGAPLLAATLSDFRAEVRLQKAKLGELRREKIVGKGRIYTRRRGSHKRDKEAHLDDFLVVCSGRGGGGQIL